MEPVVLKPGKDKALRHRHHWVFSGAVARLPEFQDGDILPVQAANGDMLGHGYFNRKSAIIGRMVSFGGEPSRDALRRHLREALELRRRFFDRTVTNACRLVNAEGDHIPGFVADLYDDVLVVQSGTLGADRLKADMVAWLDEELQPRSVYEASDLPSRREEELMPASGRLAGEEIDRVTVREDGLKFIVMPGRGQKTGFFLDQREMRKLVRETAAGRRVLNAFAYTGAFSVHALAGGAKSVDAVDTSEAALTLAGENLEGNGYGEEHGRLVVADVFDYLRQPEGEYDYIILDPPAFAKRKADVVPACRGYKDINRLAIQQVTPGGLVLTCSCSHYVDEKLFRQVVFQAAAEAGRQVRVLQTHRQGFDHPVNIYHPETEYLKGLLLYVD
jgi:23S rRNA (cytosine1962-C5)-methyltransferase